jgi:hypothetical protein
MQARSPASVGGGRYVVVDTVETSHFRRYAQPLPQGVDVHLDVGRPSLDGHSTVGLPSMMTR